MKLIGYIFAAAGLSLLWQVGGWKLALGVILWDVGQFAIERRKMN